MNPLIWPPEIRSPECSGYPVFTQPRPQAVVIPYKGDWLPFANTRGRFANNDSLEFNSPVINCEIYTMASPCQFGLQLLQTETTTIS